MVAAWLAGLAHVTLCQGDDQRAEGLLRDALALTHAHGGLRVAAECIDGFGHLARRRGWPQRAARLFGATSQLRDELGLTLPPPERPAFERELAATRATLSADEFTTAWADGHALSTTAAIAEALACPL